MIKTALRIIWAVISFIGAIPALWRRIQEWRAEREIRRLREKNHQLRVDNAVNKAVDQSDEAIRKEQERLGRREDGKVSLDFDDFNRGQ